MKKALADAIERRGYTDLTPVQEAVTKPELTGVDLLVSAQTGSGKTVGFGMAIAPVIMGDDERLGKAGAPLALVIAPTRELAMQVKRELAWLYEDAGVVMASCVGGMDMRDERRALARGAHIVVATPGRLRDHIMRNVIDLSGLKAVVLDEADEMLDLGFRDDLEFILGEAPEDRQTLMFSATVPTAIARLAKNYQKDAVRIKTTSDNSQHADIEYRALNVADRDGDNAIINTLRFYESPNAIVFCNTRAMVNRLTTRLSNRGFSVVALSGELSQNERTHALQSMRDGRARVCVATDVAARGIDLPNLDLVIHAELPNNHETLLHRSGRTGRAGRKGVSTLIVPPKVRRKAERILKMAKLNAEWGPAPSADAIRQRDEERMLSDASWQEEITKGEQGGVEKLMAQFSPEQIAVAYLRVFHAKHTAPEELSDANEKPKPRMAFGPSQWFTIVGGRNKNAEPRRLLPMFCTAGNITKDDIGAIRIQEDQSYIEIRKSAVSGFLSAIGEGMTIEGMALRKSDKPDNDTLNYERAPRGDRPERPRRPHRGSDRGPDRAHDRDRDSTPGTTTPVDWDDDRKPRTRKPKPSSKPGAKRPGGSKPYNKETSADGVAVIAKSFDRKPYAPGDRSAADGNSEGRPPRKPRSKSSGSYSDESKGPQPPKGKSNSKKNRARAKDAPRGGPKGGPRKPSGGPRRD
ncbi:MAG: DEAD/DEAH box helicase [Rhodobacteraceae bacterium]|nr:DEAD/DEAH box helicase [Paracoccaceae bacterium]